MLIIAKSIITKVVSETWEGLHCAEPYGMSRIFYEKMCGEEEEAHFTKLYNFLLEIEGIALPSLHFWNWHI